MTKKTRADELVTQINKLVDELATLSTITTSSHKQKIPSGKDGAAGAISMLIDEGFFDSPKDLQSVLQKLKEIGRYYSRPLISMNLLNLTKRRVFNRLKEGKQSWQYVLRK